MSSDEYIELARETLSKLNEFIHASEPGRSLIPLHEAYSVIKTTVDAADPESEISRERKRLEDARRTLDEIEARESERKERQEADRRQREQKRQEHAQKRNAWLGLDRDVKRGRVLTALGSGGLTRRQIVAQLRAADPEMDVYENDVVGLLGEMLTMGELEREKEPRSPNCSITAKGGYRWRWRRSRTEMSPELQQLEQRLKEA